jgi:hypothetical protein
MYHSDSSAPLNIGICPASKIALRMVYQGGIDSHTPSHVDYGHQSPPQSRQHSRIHRCGSKCTPGCCSSDTDTPPCQNLHSRISRYSNGSGMEYCQTSVTFQEIIQNSEQQVPKGPIPPDYGEYSSLALHPCRSIYPPLGRDPIAKNSPRNHSVCQVGLMHIHLLCFNFVSCYRTLQKIESCLRSQRELGKIKRLFKQTEIITQLDSCETELKAALSSIMVS